MEDQSKVKCRMSKGKSARASEGLQRWGKGPQSRTRGHREHRGRDSEFRQDPHDGRIDEKEVGGVIDRQGLFAFVFLPPRKMAHFDRGPA